MSQATYLRWVYRWAYSTDSLVWWWQLEDRIQPVLMPNAIFHWA